MKAATMIRTIIENGTEEQAREMLERMEAICDGSEDGPDYEPDDIHDDDPHTVPVECWHHGSEYYTGPEIDPRTA